MTSLASLRRAYESFEERGYRSVERMGSPPYHLLGSLVCGSAFVYYTRHSVDASVTTPFRGIDLLVSSVFGFFMVGCFCLLYVRFRSTPSLLKTVSSLIVSILIADLAEQAVYRLMEHLSSSTEISVYLREKGIDLTVGERVVIGDAVGASLGAFLCFRLLKAHKA